MIIEAYKEKTNIPHVKLRLFNSRQHVLVAVVDEQGEILSSLAVFTSEGISLWGDIDPALGFPLDDKGRLKVIE